MAIIPIGINRYFNTFDSMIISLSDVKHIKFSERVLRNENEIDLDLIFSFNSVNENIDKIIYERVYHTLMANYQLPNRVSLDKELCKVIAAVRNDFFIYDIFLRGDYYIMFRLHNKNSGNYHRIFVDGSDYNKIIDELISVYSIFNDYALELSKKTIDKFIENTEKMSSSTQNIIILLEDVPDAHIIRNSSVNSF